jgi:hypothetical protein
MPVDRKALTRLYRETPRPMGIAVICNLDNGKRLFIAGRDLPSLINRNRTQLKLGAHGNRTLQADWNALGADHFELAIVDTLEPKDTPGYDPTDDIRALEAMWLEKEQPFEPSGYHRRPK